MTPQKYGVYSETVELPQGGTVELRLTNVDPIGLDKDQRAWLFDLVDLFHQYQAEDETNVLFGP